MNKKAASHLHENSASHAARMPEFTMITAQESKLMMPA